jgi:hypothetical protein
MDKKLIIAAGLILFISVIANTALALENYFLREEINNFRASESFYIEERSVINELIPKIVPNITKEQLAGVLQTIKPEEKVDVLEHQVGWRFYHFWYSADGKITDVTYGS